MHKKIYGYLLWALVLSGYFLFAFNWVVMGELEGSASQHIGWAGTIGYTPKEVSSQAINYSITAMKGLGAILVGYVIAKIGHKYSVIISLILLSSAFPSIFFARIGGHTGFYLLIAGRMIMAIGGSVMIIYTQPIIGKFFNRKEKTLLSRLNSLGFNMAAGLGIIIFAIPIVAHALRFHWQLFDGVIAALPIVLLIIYIFAGEQIEIHMPGEGEYANEKNIKVRPVTWKSGIKAINTWKYIWFYTSYLILVAGVIFIITPTIFSMHVLKNGKTPEYFHLIPVFIYIIGLIPGIFLIGRFSKTRYDRRLYLVITSFVSIALIVISYIIMIYVKSTWVVITTTSILLLFAGMTSFGIEGVFLNIPHEDKRNAPQRVAIIISLTWGIGYIGFTLVDILLSMEFQFMHFSFEAGWVQLSIWICLSLMTPISAFILPKTRNKKTLNYFREIFTRKNKKIEQ